MREESVDTIPSGSPPSRLASVLASPDLTPTPPPVSALVPIAGSLSFESPEAQIQRTAELLGEGAIVASVAVPSSLRGQLGARIDDIIERELGARGAPSPYLAEWSTMPDDVEGRIGDQLFRARTVGARGIAIALGSLAGITQDGALGIEDSAAFRALRTMTREASLIVMVDDGDRALGVYQEPVSMASLVEVPRIRIARDVEEPARFTEPEAAAAPDLVETFVQAPVAMHVEEAPAALTDEEAAADRHARGMVAGVPVVGKNDVWRKWAIALSAARGPQPLAAFERLFVESYMPLSGAISAGVDDTRALRARDEFRDAFERSYTDAFVTFGATGRRPKLVMDAFDVASRQARLHNARTSQVLVIDALRYDLGTLVRDDLAERGGPALSLASESLLWSALPTTTFRQLETLARGLDALRAPAPDESTDSLRGRTAETVRRMRIGSRELYKLDLVPALLDEEQAVDAETDTRSLPIIAQHVSEAILRHLTTVAPRTLVFVVGDHGFSIDKRGQVTAGGASPEEVLVPCFSYLVGDLH